MNFNMQQVEDVIISEKVGNFMQKIEALETKVEDFGDLKPKEPRSQNYKKSATFQEFEMAEEVYPASKYKKSFFTKLSPLSAAGVQLSSIVLIMIAGVILLLFGYVFTISGCDKPPIDINKIAAYPDTVFQHHVELIKLERDYEKSSRDSILNLGQTILLNLLLPVLTAILGYIFGTREISSNTQQKSTE